MENAIDALKMAFAVMVFILALTVAIVMFSQLNSVSQVVLASSDITQFYEYTTATTEQSSRIVGLETIIPTLYKYYKENYTVIFLDEMGDPLPLYESQTDKNLWGTGIDPTTGRNPYVGNIGKYYTTNENLYNVYDRSSVCSFDVDEETERHEPWTGSDVDFKENLDQFLQGGFFAYPSGGTDSEGRTGYNYDEYIRGGFIYEYSDDKFKETLGEYTYDVVEEENGNELLKNRKKRVIVYQLQPNTQ